MTAKNEKVEDLPSKTEVPGPAGSTHQPDLNISNGITSKQDQNWGWMLSGVICLNVLMLGSALVSGSAHNYVEITTTDLQVFLIILLLLTSIWVICYVVYIARKDNAVVYKDGHAGPIWLRGGLVLFGLFTIIMDIFKIASYVGYLHCDSAVKVVFPVVQLVFILAQTYFLWSHAKDCVQVQKNLTRCGLMFTLSANLVVWMTAVTEESLHQTSTPNYEGNTTKLSGRSLYNSRASYGQDQCNCSHTSCGIFKDAYYYLYPFNIEYSLFASAMAYVMWKNVGRVSDLHTHHKLKFRLKHVLLGPAVGILLVVAGLATFVVYETEMRSNINDHKKAIVLMMHFIMNIVILLLMIVATVIGCAMYKVDHREHVSEKNPTRNLDVGLLVGSSLGQFIISYFSIVAMVAIGVNNYLNGLNLTWGILKVVQIALQNYFIIEGLHREPFHEVVPVTVIANPYILHPEKDLSSLEASDMDTNPSPVLTAHNLPGHTSETKLMWKRRVLKEICAFLLLGNVILWIMPAFGARPQFDYDAEIKFYKFNMWSAIVNIGLPFAIFYRMHSVASLFEVLLIS
nr:otopetrin-2-like isoform X2 [Monopterus albus]